MAKNKPINEQVAAYKEKTKLVRHDLSNGRWYENTKGVRKISATSFNSVISMGPNYDNWLIKNGENAIKIRDRKAKIGTIIHAYIDMMVSGEDVDLSKGLIDDDGHKINFRGLKDNNE